MLRWFVVMAVMVALVGVASGPALADHHPGWDPSVGYNPGHIAEGLEKGKDEGGKEAVKAFTPTADKGTAKSAPSPGAWEPGTAWRPYQHPQPVGN